MDITYQYKKTRRDFGRQPMFCEVPSHLLDSIEPDANEHKRYILRNPVNRESQASVSKSEHTCNTRSVVLTEQGANHLEGGWPKDVNYLDEEAVIRYRRRVERDDAYVEAVLSTQDNLAHYIKQNNAIDMYRLFFKEFPQENPVEKSTVVVKSEFKDAFRRPVASIGWTYEEDSKIVVSYCDKKFPITGPVNKELSFYVWNVENPYWPEVIVEPPSSCWQIACSPVNPSVILGGFEDGRVCLFDIRDSTEPKLISPHHLAHLDPVTSLIYIQSRLNTEFFSGSTDGKCMWWDIRNISLPIDAMIMSVQIPPGENATCSNSEGVSSLQFDRAFPTRFLCGTDTGLVINVNRKGKTHQETLSAVFNAHLGPVRTVARSPLTSKLFITCGDWTVHLWSDDIHTSPIVTGMPHRYQITDVSFAPQRFSSYISVSADGKFRYWDLLRKFHEPILICPVSKYPLLKVKPNEDGRFFAVGDKRGSLILLSLSDNLIVSGDKDKPLMLQSFERDIRREHILETRIKEIRLKLRNAEEEEIGPPVEEVDELALVNKAEELYRKEVAEEIYRLGITTVTAARPKKGRK